MSAPAGDNPLSSSASGADPPPPSGADHRQKLERLLAGGCDPFPARVRRSATAAQLHEDYRDLAPDAHTGVSHQVTGRLLSIRGHGRLVFATIADSTGELQLLLERPTLDAASLLVLDNCDTGDWLGADGQVITTRRGELSIEVGHLTMLAKTLRPLPDRWHGVVDPETRYRHREVDLLVNPATRRVFEIRSATITTLRQLLGAQGFMEVETPILQPQAGGAIARPFLTYHNALKTQLSLRIAPELYLKRLIVGGYERVFELGKDFRNEGIDTRHSPEFTAMEAYQAFGDVTDGMALTEQLIVGCATAATGTFSFTQGDHHIDLTPPWPRRQLLDLVAEAVGVRLHPTTPLPEVRAVCDEHQVAYEEGWGSGRLIFELYDKVLLPGETGPLFVCGYPVEISPLAKRSPDDPTLAERFELVIGGRELANGYSELNDPDDQRSRFALESSLVDRGDLEAHPADADFIQALEQGLPPTSGIGIGVDRLIMLLAEVPAIRDVILFPLLRPSAPSP